MANRLTKWLGGLTHRDSLNNPAVPLSAAGFFAWAFGGEPTSAGELVTAQSAFKQVTVMACVRCLADGIATMPCRTYKVSASGKEETPTNPVAALLIREPNDEMTAHTFVFSLVMALVSYGACFAEIQRSSAGIPIGLWPLHPACTNILRDPQGNIYFETTDSPDSKLRRIKAEDMIYVPYMGLTGIEGMSLVGVAKEAIGLTIAAEKFGSRFLGNYAAPGGFFINEEAEEMTDEQKQLFHTSIEQGFSGTSQHRIGVFTGKWKFFPNTTSPKDSQLVELRQFQRTEIAALFNVPPSKIGDTSKQSKASAEQENLAFLIDTLLPIADRLEQEFVRKLFPGQTEILIEFDFRQRTRGDFQSTMQGIAVGRQWGVMNEDEGRKWMGLNPRNTPESKIMWAPVNMQNAAWLVKTESIQDQPVDNPALPQPEQKSRLKRLEDSYMLLFRDAMGRTIQRPAETRSKAAGQIFEPVIRSLSAAIGADEKHAAAVMSGLAKRAAKWAEVDIDGPGEFQRVIRSLHINAMRDRAAKYAEQEITLALPAPTKEDDEN